MFTSSDYRAFQRLKDNFLTQGMQTQSPLSLRKIDDNLNLRTDDKYEAYSNSLRGPVNAGKGLRDMNKFPHFPDYVGAYSKSHPGHRVGDIDARRLPRDFSDCNTD